MKYNSWTRIKHGIRFLKFHSSLRKLIFFISDIEFNFVSGNFSMISGAWKNGEKTGYKDRPVLYYCTTNDEDATVSLQYYTNKWNNIMTPSKKYPAGSIVQFGQVFLLRRYRGIHQSGFFRCIAKAHGDVICLNLGILLYAGEYVWEDRFQIFKSTKTGGRKIQ